MRTHWCGHIVAHDVFWAAQTGKHLLWTQNVSEQNKKHFCVPDTKFVSATNVARAGKRGNICVGNNVSATMCPRLRGPLWVGAAKAKWTKRGAKVSTEDRLIELPEKKQKKESNDKWLNNWNEKTKTNTNYSKIENISQRQNNGSLQVSLRKCNWSRELWSLEQTVIERKCYPNGSRHRLMCYLTRNMPDAEVKIMKR